MSEKRRALGRGLGALIPNAPVAGGRPTDIFYGGDDVSRETELPPEPTQDRDPGVEDVSRETAPRPEPRGKTDEHVSRETAGSTKQPADGLAPVPGARFAEVPVDQIRPNPRQPRTVFAEEEMAELVDSIRELGVLQPIVVRPTDDPDTQFELVMGERRWRASQAAGNSTVPAIIKETHDDDLLRDALLENLHRSQLNALEEAAAYQQLLDDFGCTHEELATRIGRSRPQISNTLRLLKLPPLVQRRVAAGVLSAGHARALLGLPDGAAMERLAQRIVAEGLSVRTTEELVALGGEESARSPRARNVQPPSPELSEMASRLSDRLDTRVRIAMGKHKGRITVEFASEDDLTRIIETLGLRPE